MIRLQTRDPRWFASKHTSISLGDCWTVFITIRHQDVEAAGRARTCARAHQQSDSWETFTNFSKVKQNSRTVWKRVAEFLGKTHFCSLATAKSGPTGRDTELLWARLGRFEPHNGFEW